MSVDWPGRPQEPLLAFGAGLGIPPEVWAAREELRQISYTDPHVSREAAVGLTMEQFTPLLEAYADALTCRFLLGELPVLEVIPGLNETALSDFDARTRLSPTVALELRLDKTRLLANWLGDAPGCSLFLLLFTQALERLLAGDLRGLESQLWGTETGRKAVLLAPGREIWLDGPYLAVLGGARIGDWRAAVPRQPSDAELPRRLYNTCRDTLKWQEPWLQHLTSLHLKLEGQAAPDDPIVHALRTHLTNLIVLYTADRTALQAGRRWIATYAGAQQSVKVPLGDPRERLGPNSEEGARALMRLLEWAYDPRWANDRLDLVQIAVAQALHGAREEDRYRLLLHNSANIFDALQWEWKAFIERKMDVYTAEVRALENDVVETIHSFADQVAAMIKSLSETMLAAVAVLLGSFIAALFKADFNATVFRIGMLVYALYVLVFPLAYRMLHQWSCYRALSRGFAARRARFEELLYPQRVAGLVGTQITDSEARFERWFWATLVAYVVVILLALVAAAGVPGWITPAGSSPLPAPTPAP
jgi:hypothetical protein